jgi:hypothetical protein
MAHPLDGALAHVDRADRDFDELKSLLEKFTREEHQKILAYYDFASREGIHKIYLGGIQTISYPAVPFSAAVLVSAVIHHLRAALDYLVYELALQDSGVVQDGTQFIIEDIKADPKNVRRGFDGRAKSKFAGISPFHISMFEELQPYKGVQWTAILRDISNSDKHRKLTVIRSSQTTSHGFVTGEPGTFDARPGPTERSLDGTYDIHLHQDSTFFVGFPEWRNIPVLETLEILKGEVRATIDRFKPEFK